MNLIKTVRFVNNSRKKLIELGEHACNEIGLEIMALQYGGEPKDFKPFPLGNKKGIFEIRCRNEQGQNKLRSAYVVKHPEAIYVLHCWTKSSQKTAEDDKKIIEKAYIEMERIRSEEK